MSEPLAIGLPLTAPFSAAEVLLGRSELLHYDRSSEALLTRSCS